MIKANGDSFTPSRSHSLLSFLRNSSSSVISASSCWVTCGIITQLRARFWPEIFLIRESSFTSTAPNLVKSTFGHGKRSKPPPKEAAGAAALFSAPPFCITPFTKDLTSSFTIRPLAPLPLTKPKSTPSSRASLRTEGPACALIKAASLIGVAPKAAFGAPLAAGAAGAAAAGVGAAFGASVAGAVACGAAVGAVEAAPSTSIIFAPCETLSPTLM